jgi:hypothetical protein
LKGKIMLITIIAAIDAFLVFFAIGFNSKHALVEDPSLPPVDMEKVRQSVEEREAKPKARKTIKAVEQGGAAKPVEQKKPVGKSRAKKKRSKSN